MTSITMHAKGITVDLERRCTVGVPEPYATLGVKLKTRTGTGTNYITIHFDTVAYGELKEIRDQIDGYLAEIERTANG